MSLESASRDRCYDGNERLDRWYYPVEGGNRVFQLYDPADAGYNTRTLRGDQHAKISSGLLERTFGAECLFNEGLEANEFDIDEDGALILRADDEEEPADDNGDSMDMLQRLADEVQNFGTNPADFQTLEDIQRLAYSNSNALETYTRCDGYQMRPTVGGNWA
jgi:hypothetical protein